MEDKKLIVKWMIKDGMSHRQIQEATGVGLATISRWRNKGETTGVETGVIINDPHIPFEDKAVVSIAISHIKMVKPNYVLILGDLGDFYTISKFSKDPKRATPKEFVRELFLVRQFLSSIRTASPKSKIIFVPGNHDVRLRAYLWTVAPMLNFDDIDEFSDIPEYQDIPKTNIQTYYGLDKYGVEYCPNGYWMGKMFCYHGSIVRKHSGYTAKAEYDKNGCVGISGHTHRDGKYTLRNRSGQWVWWENFCLCDLSPEYMKGDVANWTQGFSHVTIVNGSPRVEQIPIVDGFYVFGGKVYR